MGKEVILPPEGGDGEIIPVRLRTALEERYLAYALSTIMNGTEGPRNPARRSRTP